MRNCYEYRKDKRVSCCIVSSCSTFSPFNGTCGTDIQSNWEPPYCCSGLTAMHRLEDNPQLS